MYSGSSGSLSSGFRPSEGKASLSDILAIDSWTFSIFSYLLIYLFSWLNFFLHVISVYACAKQSVASPCAVLYSVTMETSWKLGIPRFAAGGCVWCPASLSWQALFVGHKQSLSKQATFEAETKSPHTPLLLNQYSLTKSSTTLLAERVFPCVGVLYRYTDR